MLRDILAKMKPTDIEQYEVKPEKYSGVPMGDTYLPTLCLNDKALPEIKDWDVDGEYVLVLKVKQKSKSMNTQGKEERYHADFEIKEIAYLDTKDDKKEDKEEDDVEVKVPPLMKMYGKK